MMAKTPTISELRKAGPQLSKMRKTAVALLFLQAVYSLQAVHGFMMTATSGMIRFRGGVGESRTRITQAKMTVQLFGSQGSRSPLVNWYLYELKTPFQMAPRERNPHPFGQIPCLKDGDIEVPTTTFEFFSAFVHIVNINVPFRYSRAAQSFCILPRNTVVSALPKPWRRLPSGWCGQTPL
jgi:hypothetical protein